jgi:hypothetical protein
VLPWLALVPGGLSGWSARHGAACAGRGHRAWW